MITLYDFLKIYILQRKLIYCYGAIRCQNRMPIGVLFSFKSINFGSGVQCLMLTHRQCLGNIPPTLWFVGECRGFQPSFFNFIFCYIKPLQMALLSCLQGLSSFKLCYIAKRTKSTFFCILLESCQKESVSTVAIKCIIFYITLWQIMNV